MVVCSQPSFLKGAIITAYQLSVNIQITLQSILWSPAVKQICICKHYCLVITIVDKNMKSDKFNRGCSQDYFKGGAKLHKKKIL